MLFIYLAFSGFSHFHSRSRDSPRRPLRPLPMTQTLRVFSPHHSGALLHHLLALGQDQLDVARVAHVGVDAAVGTVCAAALFGSLVDLDVLDDQVAGVEAFGVGVGFGVAEEREKEFGGLDGPAGAGDTKMFTCRWSGVSTSVGRVVIDDCGG